MAITLDKLFIVDTDSDEKRSERNEERDILKKEMEREIEVFAKILEHRLNEEMRKMDKENKKRYMYHKQKRNVDSDWYEDIK